MTQLSPSNGAQRDRHPVGDAPLIVAGRALAERGHYGFVWADDQFIVSARYGRLVDFVSIGEPLNHDLPALVGLERDIALLKKRSGAVLELPAVAIVSADGQTPRLNILMMWIAEQESYLCLVMRTGIGSDTEVELSREMRRRLIAEAEVMAKSRELARANRDLEEYTSVISHDLQAPMRALRYQIDELQPALKDETPEQVSVRLDRMRRQAVRMGKMLSALLEYSSIGRKTDALSELDTEQIIQAIISSIKQSPDRRIEVSGDWPTLVTLEQPLDLVLRNLIDNAVKHHRGSKLAIDVHAEDVGDHLEISVSDNGPGIAEPHRESIFLPFTTIEKDQGEDVRGLGLAIVHRIVAGVGGHISVGSRADGETGAVFRLIWPKTISE